MAVITFASSKGGVGKSTTAGALAAFMAGQGARVHVIDVDPNDYSLSRVLGENPWEGVTIQSARQKDFREQFNDALMIDGVTHIFIDLAGMREVTLIKAAQRSDLVVIPAQHSVQDIGEALAIIGDLADVSEGRPTPIQYRMMFTQVRSFVTKLDRHVEEEVKREGIIRFGAYIKDRVAYREMWANGVAPHERDPKAADELKELHKQLSAILSGSEASLVEGAA